VNAGARHHLEAARLNPADPQIVWQARRSRALEGPFAAPLLFALRLTRGKLPLVWGPVFLAIYELHQPWLTAAGYGFGAYIWAVRGYMRLRFGKTPK
jgi:hypothetical protein